MSADDVEFLARWMHETCQRVGRPHIDEDGELVAPMAMPWEEVAEYRQGWYRAVAAEMMERPPEVLVNAIIAKPMFVETP